MIERSTVNHALVESNEGILDDLEGIVEDLGMHPPADYRPGTITVKNRRWRRANAHTFNARMGIMTMREQDGVLLLDDGLPNPLVPRSARARGDGLRRGRLRPQGRRPIGLNGELVAKVPFERLAHGDVPKALETLDRKLTPRLGLRELTANDKLKRARAADKGRILLFVHGTFSNNDSLIKTLSKTSHGSAFLTRIRKIYDQVLTFDHRTLGVSPILNARQLALETRHSSAAIDVVCHSRGGLVTRWWLEALDTAPGRQRRAVFVGCPLAGTGLAAPPNLRASLSMMANINKALRLGAQAGASALPFLAVAAGLFKVVASITDFAAKTPILDAAVALVPGLHAMSRIGNNREINSMRADAADVRQRYYAVRANFESEKAEWRFWKYFRDPKKRLADWVTDQVFKGKNDLVVDTASMTDLTSKLNIPQQQILDFGTTDKVHHTNYFEQARTLQRILKWLGPSPG